MFILLTSIFSRSFCLLLQPLETSTWHGGSWCLCHKKSNTRDVQHTARGVLACLPLYVCQESWWCSGDGWCYGWGLNLRNESWNSKQMSLPFPKRVCPGGDFCFIALSLLISLLFFKNQSKNTLFHHSRQKPLNSSQRALEKYCSSSTWAHPALTLPGLLPAPSTSTVVGSQVQPQLPLGFSIFNHSALFWSHAILSDGENPNYLSFYTTSQLSAPAGLQEATTAGGLARLGEGQLDQLWQSSWKGKSKSKQQSLSTSITLYYWFDWYSNIV